MLHDAIVNLGKDIIDNIHTGSLCLSLGSLLRCNLALKELAENGVHPSLVTWSTSWACMAVSRCDEGDGGVRFCRKWN